MLYGLRKHNISIRFTTHNTWIRYILPIFLPLRTFIVNLLGKYMKSTYFFVPNWSPTFRMLLIFPQSTEPVFIFPVHDLFLFSTVWTVLHHVSRSLSLFFIYSGIDLPPPSSLCATTNVVFTVYHHICFIFLVDIVFLYTLLAYVCNNFISFVLC